MPHAQFQTSSFADIRCCMSCHWRLVIWSDVPALLQHHHSLSVSHELSSFLSASGAIFLAPMVGLVRSVSTAVRVKTEQSATRVTDGVSVGRVSMVTGETHNGLLQINSSKQTYNPTRNWCAIFAPVIWTWFVYWSSIWLLWECCYHSQGPLILKTQTC